MNNRDLFTQVQQGIAVLADGTAEDAPIDFQGATTTRVRYATKENRDRLQDCLETYKEMLQEIAEEEDVETEDLNAAQQELIQAPEKDPANVAQELGISEEAVEELEELLAQETPFEAYTVPEQAIFQEQGVPLVVLDLIDWMIE